MHVGQQYPHKNLRRLIQAFAHLAPRHPELRLVLAGKPHPTETPVLKALVQKLGILGHVEFRSYVPYTELPDLYRGALAFVYPSLWEGFGLPILEAMACGTPVITSRGSGTEEVAGDATLLVDPMNEQALAQAMLSLLMHNGERLGLRRSGIERAKLFGWQLTRLATSQVIEAHA